MMGETLELSQREATLTPAVNPACHAHQAPIPGGEERAYVPLIEQIIEPNCAFSLRL